MINVAVFEDYTTLRDGLFYLIDGTPDMRCTGAYADCKNLEKKLKESQPDVVLMDIGLPGISGIEAVRIIKKSNPNIRVLMQTVFEDDDKIFAAICAGASGYILKKTPPSVLLEAIKDVHQGGAPLSSTIANKVLTMFQKMSKPPQDECGNLSAREKEVLTHLVNGKSYKMIADECNIGYDTVRFHMKNIYEKLHVSSMTEAVAKAINNRIV